MPTDVWAAYSTEQCQTGLSQNGPRYTTIVFQSSERHPDGILPVGIHVDGGASYPLGLWPRPAVRTHQAALTGIDAFSDLHCQLPRVEAVHSRGSSELPGSGISSRDPDEEIDDRLLRPRTLSCRHFRPELCPFQID